MLGTPKQSSNAGRWKRCNMVSYLNRLLHRSTYWQETKTRPLFIPSLSAALIFAPLSSNNVTVVSLPSPAACIRAVLPRKRTQRQQTHTANTITLYPKQAGTQRTRGGVRAMGARQLLRKMRGLQLFFSQLEPSGYKFNLFISRN